MKLKLFKAPIALVLMLLAVASCNSWDDGWSKPPKDVQGYKPVYITAQEAYTVSVLAPRTLEKPGKIYIYQGLLFIVERLKGVHVINNADPSNPQPIAYLSVPGCNDVAVNSGYLYADNVTDLVTFNIKDPDNITFEKRLTGRFPHGLKLYPEQARDNYFECVDTTKGIVIDWEYTTLNNPKCYR
jgi:hypothetical protein